MTTETQVVWANNFLTEEQKTAINGYVAQMVSQGATDGVATIVNVDESSFKVTRHWTTVNDATSWITFIAGYNPISAEIIE